MLALKSERKRSFLITWAIRATAILKFTAHLGGAWKQIGLFRSAARPLRAQIVTVFVRFRRDFLCSVRGLKCLRRGKMWISYPLG